MNFLDQFKFLDNIIPKRLHTQMKETLILERGQREQDQRISETVEREQARLHKLLRRLVADVEQRGDLRLPIL